MDSRLLARDGDGQITLHADDIVNSNSSCKVRSGSDGRNFSIVVCPLKTFLAIALRLRKARLGQVVKVVSYANARSSKKEGESGLFVNRQRFLYCTGPGTFFCWFATAERDLQPAEL
ncbi:hypothetical protein EVAR_103651_1 [Eumeta japonica]|uniref:Uncharacterized protein n=1 Tax=Eumeta variegata TaxID=151549 RepID=A0A4C1Z4U1_EUMVA|nr:hypothetical protein EVAR_103651_1 [Eumeta japonica]